MVDLVMADLNEDLRLSWQ